MNTLKQTTISLFFLLTTFSLSAQEIIRGPYLQSGGSTSMIVKWRTDTPVNSKVWLGASPNSLNSSTSKNEVTTEHEVLIQGLTPDTKYYYTVGTQSSRLLDGDSEQYFFTSPNIGDEKQTNIWVIGDGGKATQKARDVRDGYYDYIDDQETDLILMLGDNAYTDGTDEEYQVAVFEDMYEDILLHSPLWSCPGNHEYVASNNVTKTGPYYDIFTFPTNGEIGGLPSGSEAYYSFDYGNIHFISLDSQDEGIRPGEPMHVWLENDLNTTNQDWIIVFFHYPPYSKGSHDSDDDPLMTKMREILVPVLEAGGADLVLTGHSHSYERSYLINGHYGFSDTFSPEMMVDDGNGRLDEDGAYQKLTDGVEINPGSVYVVSGSASTTTAAPLDHPAMYYSAATLGSLSLEIEGDQLDLKFIDRGGDVRDYFTMRKIGLPLGNAPTLSLGYPNPAEDRLVDEDILVTATTDDADDDLVKVEFYVDGAYVRTDYNEPYELNFSADEPGTYSITASATDGEGNVGFSNTALITIVEDIDPGPSAGITVVSFPLPTNGISPDTPVTWNEPLFTTDCRIMEITNNTTQGPCTPITVPNTTDLGIFGSHQYLYNSTASTWQEAKAYSESIGGTLVSIENAQENEFIQEAIPGSSIWIGFTDESMGGQFEWSDGQLVDYTNWGSWRPKSYRGTARHVQLKKSDGRWYDKDNDHKQSFVVKIPCTGNENGAPDTIWVAGTLMVEQITPIPNGGLFPVGVSTVTYRAMDDCNNVHTASFTVTIPGSESPNVCSEGVPNFSGFEYLTSTSTAHYFLSDGKFRWVDGQDLCVANGGYLASIGSVAENDIILESLSGIRDYVMIGLSDQVEEGTLTWADGSAYTFDNLVSNENDPSINFGLMSPWEGTWKLESKYVRKRVVMELPCNTNTATLYGTLNKKNINDLHTKSFLHTYPNPAKEVLNLKYTHNEESAKVRITILNAYGAVVWQKDKPLDFNTQQWSVTTKDWPEGIYVVHLETGSERITQRFMKVNK